jgi:hypothetical protein
MESVLVRDDQEYKRIASLKFRANDGRWFSLVSTQWNAYCVNTSKPLIDAIIFLNTHNRRPKENDIELLRTTIRRGEFCELNQGVGISVPDEQGHSFIIDGQNRAIANALEGYPVIPLLIAVGLPPKAQIWVDMHAKRTQTDILKLALDKRAQTIYTAVFNARNRFRLRNGSAALTIPELAEEYSENLDNLIPIVKAVGKYKRAPFLAALLDYSLRSNLESVLQLSEQIRTGSMISKDSPAWRARMLLDGIKGSGGGAEQLSLYRKTISICVAHWRGEYLAQIRETMDWPTLTGMPGKKR